MSVNQAELIGKNMLLQSFKRIIKGDFEEVYQEMIDKLAYSINQSFDNILDALNNNISLNNNIACTLRDLLVNVGPDGTPLRTANIKLLNAQVKAIGCTVISSINNTNNTRIPTSQPFITFTQNNDIIIINNISGLRTNDSYTLKVIVWHG